MLYPKPYTSHTQQLALLTSRGLTVQNNAQALCCLARTGYYRLSAYWYPFRVSHLLPNLGTGAPEINKVGPPDRFVTDQFKLGYSFEDAHDFYVFDKKLRLLLSDALERIEVSVRSRVVEHLGQKSPMAHRDPANFSRKFTTNLSRRSKPGAPLTLYQDWIGQQDKLFDRSKEDFAEHFRSKYAVGGILHPAIWVASETWDWGALSHCFGGLPPADQHAIASVFSSMNGRDLASWLRHLNDLRNICAHHSRLWNRNTANPPRVPNAGAIPMLDHLRLDNMSTRRLYGGLAICAFMMRTLYPKTQWHIRLREFVRAEAPQANIIDPKVAGFPADWHLLPIWN